MAYPKMQHPYTPELVAEIQAYIDESTEDVGSICLCFNKIKRTLRTLSIMTKRQIKPELVLCHESNRGGLGLNGEDSDIKLAGVHKIGFDPDEVKKAVCIELCPLEPKRGEQLKWNAKQAEGSRGLIPPVVGNELVLSLGCGHFSNGLRNANAGGKTLQEDIADAHGNIDRERLCRDEWMKQALNEGLEWDCIPWQAEVAWPRLPHIIQAGCNASQHLYTEETEPTVMLNMCKEHDRLIQAGIEHPSWDHCEKVGIQSNPPCKSYSGILRDFSEQFSGGVGAPVIAEIARFCKNNAKSRIIGGSFYKNIIELKIDPLRSCIYVRQAAVKAQSACVSKYMEGNLCNFIKKNHLSQLVHKDKIDLVLQDLVLMRVLMLCCSIHVMYVLMLCVLFMLYMLCMCSCHVY
jgi:hypothetical protein